MELKGLDKIDNALNAWLIKYGFTARIAGVQEDFYWYHNDTISYSFFFAEDAVEPWANLLNELKCNFILDTFYSVFLHELGHSVTYDKLSRQDVEYSDDIKLAIAADPASFDNPRDVYWHLPVEIEATKWAVNFINSYPDRVKELVDTVGAAVREFYEINDVVDEDSFDFS